MKTHLCAEPAKFCSCGIAALEPEDTCPFHGGNTQGKRCGTCGRFMKSKIPPVCTDKDLYELETFCRNYLRIEPINDKFYHTTEPVRIPDAIYMKIDK